MMDAVTVSRLSVMVALMVRLGVPYACADEIMPVQENWPAECDRPYVDTNKSCSLLRTSSSFEELRVAGSTTVMATGEYALILDRKRDNYQDHPTPDWLQSAFGVEHPDWSETVFTSNINGEIVANNKFNVDGWKFISGGRFLSVPAFGVNLIPRIGNHAIGDFSNLAHDLGPVPCINGVQIEDLTIKLPKGVVVGRVPNNVDVDYGPFHYKTSWGVFLPKVQVVRQLESHVSNDRCDGDVAVKAATLIQIILRDLKKPVELKDELTFGKW